MTTPALPTSANLFAAARSLVPAQLAALLASTAVQRATWTLTASALAVGWPPPATIKAYSAKRPFPADAFLLSWDVVATFVWASAPAAWVELSASPSGGGGGSPLFHLDSGTGQEFDEPLVFPVTDPPLVQLTNNSGNGPPTSGSLVLDVYYTFYRDAGPIP